MNCQKWPSCQYNATASPVPSYNNRILALNQAYDNIKIAFDPSKVHTKSTNRRKMIMKALVDKGVNGGIVGIEDSRPLNPTFNCWRSVNVTSLGRRTVQDVSIEVICAVARSLDGSVLCIYHNYATGEIQTTTIRSIEQSQDHNNNVDDTILMLRGS